MLKKTSLNFLIIMKKQMRRIIEKKSKVNIAKLEEITLFSCLDRQLLSPLLIKLGDLKPYREKNIKHRMMIIFIEQILTK